MFPSAASSPPGDVSRYASTARCVDGLDAVPSRARTTMTLIVEGFGNTITHERDSALTGTALLINLAGITYGWTGAR